jgi:PGF-CTERM protein
MKVKPILIYVLLVVTLSTFLFLSPFCSAQHANVSIKDVTVQLTQTRPPIGTTTIREYTITAILQNTGDSESVNITVKLKDPQPGLNATLIFQPKNSSLKPNEEKTFLFENWPTSLSSDIALNISFQPSSPDVLLTEFNSGFYIYTLHIGDGTKTTSTPGFEVLVVLIAILAFLFIKQIRK